MTTNNNAAFELVPFDIITQTVESGSSGDDYLEGTSGDDFLEGLEGYDTLDGKEGNDNLDGGMEDDTLYGGTGDDSLMGGDGNDYIDAGTGDDTVIGGYGDDLLYKDLSSESTSINFDYSDYHSGNIQEIEAVILYTGSGDDTIVSTVYDENGYSYDYYINEITSGDGNDSITTGYGNDSLSGGDGDDYLESRDGDDYIDTGTGDDTATGGLGNDIFFRDDSSATTNIIFSYTDQDGEGFDTLYGVVDSGNIREFERIILHTGSGNDKIIAYAASGFNDYGYANEIHSGSGHDTIVTGSGNDSLYGGDGNDYLYSGSGDDVIDPGSGNDTVDGGAGYDRIESDFSSSTDDLNFNSNIQGIEKFTLQTGAGDDTILATASSSRVESGSGNDSITTGDLADFLVGGEGNDTISAGGGSDNLYGGRGNDVLSGGDGNDGLSDNYPYDTDDNGDDFLDGGNGDDWFSLGRGHDTVVGGAGTDFVRIDRSTETNNINFSYTDPNSGNIQGIEQTYIETGSGDDTIVSTAATFSGFNFYSKQDYANLILSNGGNDSITTGNGNDNIAAGDGDDTINSGGGNDIFSGGNGDDFLDGGDGNDYIIVGTGNDTVIGGAGTDAVAIDYRTETGNVNFSHTNPNSANIQEIEQVQMATGSGNDTIVSTAITIGGYDRFNQYYAHQIATYSGNDSITTASGIDILNGGDGDDTISSGSGDDTIRGDNGNDLITSVDPLAIAPGQGEIDHIYTNNGNDSIILADESNIFYDDNSTNSGGLSDYAKIYDFNPTVDRIQLQGSASYYRLDIFPSDAYLYIDKADHEPDEQIAYLTGNLSGLSLTSSAFTYIPPTPTTLTLSVNPASVPEDGSTNLIYTFNRTGDLGDALTVNFNVAGTATFETDYTQMGATSFDGSDGTITFASGSPTTTLTIVPKSDSQIEADETVDIIFSSDTDYIVDSSGIATGTIVDNDVAPSIPEITLAVGANRITENGTANLIYTFTRAGNLSGTLKVNFTVGGTASFTGLDYSRSGASFSGNNGSITFAANSATARLTINPTGDTLIESDETVIVAIVSGNNYTFGTIDPTTGTIVNDDGGNTDDLLIGGVGADTLDGKEGNDTMIGAAGNDTYFVESLGDVITENPDEGTDIVNASISYTLGDHLEKINLLGDNNLNGTGNTLNNSLNGNSGNNTLTGLEGNDILDGKEGDDTLIGGKGNDSYTVNSSEDIITENANEGTDSVKTSVSFSLNGTSVENLTLTGTSNIDGIGNNANNTLTGNRGNNTLTGLDGNDKLNGITGNDTLIGGTGNDSYTVDGGDTVTENTDEGTDSVSSSASYTLSDNLENLTLTGTANIDGTGNDLNNHLIGNTDDNTLTGHGGNDTLDGKAGNDNLIGGLGDDTYTIDAGDSITENTSEGLDTVKSSVTFSLVGTNLEHLTLSGNASLDGTGNEFDNLLTGNKGNNSLTGEDGNDTLLGGNGNDTLVGGVGIDSLTGGSGQDSFVFDTLTEGIDKITDFRVIDDSFIVSASGFGGELVVGNPAANQLRMGSAATTIDHRLIYNSSTGGLFFDIDGVGETAAIQFATLGTKLALTSADFSVIA